MIVYVCVLCCSALLCSALRFLFCVLRLFNFSPGPTGTKEPKSRRAYIDYRINLMFGLHHPVPYTVCVCVCGQMCMSDDVAKRSTSLSHPFIFQMLLLLLLLFISTGMDGWMELSIPSIHNWQYAAPAFIPLLHMNVNRVK